MLVPVPFRLLGGQVEQVLHGANPHVQSSAAVVHHLWYLDRNDGFDLIPALCPEAGYKDISMGGRAHIT